MEPILVALGLAFGLFVACYGAGYLPLVWTLSESRVQLLTLFGAGLLTGAALGIIIPEGIHSLYSATHVSHAGELSTTEAGVAHTHSHEQADDNHAIVGTVLVTGFVCMLLIDQASARRNKDDAAGSKWTATIGLIVHAAADGLAMGAAVASAKEEITFIVFLAILLHKAPAAFGLVSFLMYDNTLDKSQIQRHLFFFSLSTPVSSLLTTICLSLIWAADGTGMGSASSYGTGIALLFSAGTFLYVATVHVLPEVTAQPPSLPAAASASPHHHHGLQRAFTLNQLGFLVSGMVLPLLLGLMHSH